MILPLQMQFVCTTICTCTVGVYVCKMQMYFIVNFCTYTHHVKCQWQSLSKTYYTATLEQLRFIHWWWWSNHLHASIKNCSVQPVACKVAESQVTSSCITNKEWINVFQLMRKYDLKRTIPLLCINVFSTV